MNASTRVIMARDRAQELIDKIVKMSKADGVTVTIDSGYQADVRFAANQTANCGGRMHWLWFGLRLCESRGG